jgi:hypothetical protein
MLAPRTGFRILQAFFAGALAFAAASAQGSEAWVVCLRTTYLTGYVGQAACEGLSWHDKLYFFNSNPEAVSVKLLGVSNGPLNPYAQDITVPAGSLFAANVSAPPVSWDPCVSSCPVTIFVARVDVPDGVLMSSRLEVVSSEVFASDSVCPLGGPLDFIPGEFAGVPLPVRRELTPTAVRQYHLGIDAGSAGFGAAAADARTNIGIYNQASVTANGTIETRRGCDDMVIERRVVTIPPNSIVQFNGLSSNTSGCGAGIKAPRHTAYAIVTVDQPSFSYAITLRNDLPPKFAGTAPVTQ